MSQVRRIQAILLLAVFGVSLASPVMFAADGFASDNDSKLPACCRREGHHHCAMVTGPDESSSGPTVQASRCPFFPVAHGTPANPTIGLLKISPAAFVAHVDHSTARAYVEELCHTSFSRAGQKRGPPLSFPS